MAGRFPRFSDMSYSELSVYLLLTMCHLDVPLAV